MNELNFDRIPEIALEWAREGRRVALATVVETWGSAPRPVGSQLVIDADAGMMGSVSGGCVEGAVVEEALGAMEEGTPRILTYGVSDDDAFSVGLACGGTIRVLVEPVGGEHGIDVPLLERLVMERAARRPVGYTIGPDGWHRLLIDRAAGTPLGDLVRARLDADRSGFDEVSGERWFTAVNNPPLRMVIVGAVHIAQVLAPMATMAGFDVTVIDPRSAFAQDARFGDVTLVTEWPDEALRAHGIDSRTAVVTLTHDPKLDDPALREALVSPAFYIGALGSRRTHAKRVERLRAAGFDDAAIDRIEAPVGLDIGAKTPAEIAVSIISQVTERLRRPDTRPRQA